ncbi:hypothetical protein VKT23_011723 [Stygiomarasmius scandens]|uniref:DUF4246 domain-containing protein n=1 Tax=Marasmiellus scandens TaxID=2682957 RepID=A0ABR1JCH6_9AGAR
MSAAHTVANDDQLERFSGIVHSKKEWHLQALSEKDPLVKWGLDEGLFIQSTDRSGQSVEEAVDGAWGLTYALKDEAQALKDNLSTFCKAVRRKKDWYLKLLDSEQDLAQKWVIEAGLLPNIPEGPVLDVIQELKSEAKRIKAIDHDAIELQTRLEPPRLTENWYNATQQEILRRIRYATTSEYGIRVPELKENVGALVSDGLVPDALHAELVRELDLLAAKEPRDFHPGTFGKVQDLIHPSLYPYIAGYSDVLPNASTPMPSLTSAESFSDKDLNPQAFESEMTVNDQDIVFQSRYAWIPTVFSVNKEGTDVHLQSYINGIGPREEHPDLYRLLEKLEKTLQISADYEGYRDANSSQRKELDGATEQQWNDLLARQKAEKEEEAEQIRNIDHEAEEERKRWFSTDRGDEPDATLEEPSSGWKGKDLKIIVKAANYIFRPGQEYSGTWHIEGMPHERVAASAIYYYDTNESIIDDGLSLRRFRHSEDDFPQQEELRHEESLPFRRNTC